MKLFNTLTMKKEDLIPVKPGHVGMYTCGPTVYLYQHIGNLRAYIFADTLKRVLLYDKLKVDHVINVTDVGHLTSDSDVGEDKMERAAEREGKTAEEIANFYLKVFKSDLNKLNILEPTTWCKATEHIAEQIDLIKRLEKKGYTYKTYDGIYFDTSKFKDYGKFSRINKEELEAGKRTEMREKKSVTDFALWKFSEKPGLRQQEWDSPWGIGFPGWHIECSAMSMKYLGEHIDIHTGGIDHIKIHHQNEIAQSDAAVGSRVVNMWIHNDFLTVRGEKISKSKGGLFTLSELEERGYSPMYFKYLILSAHYRRPLDFSLEILDQSKNSYERLKNIISELEDDKKTNKEYLKKFENAMLDDLGTPNALAILWEMLRDQKADGKLKTIKKMDEMLGLDLLKKGKIDIPKDVKKLVEEREKARKKKDFKESDRIRNEIKELGYILEDSPDGPKIKKF